MKDTNKKKIELFKDSLSDSFDKERLKNIDISIEGYLDRFEHLGNMDIPEETKTVIRDIKLLQIKNEDSLTKAAELIKQIEKGLLEL
ncbi:MAG: hypothetical protein H7A25_01355 [Leptospiraceae bacterium]|nr:hypothetical protein [Leptospiraceae bacterium]MCP5498522.1 hypothetical protein [Leptospiraceae bacterium]